MPPPFFWAVVFFFYTLVITAPLPLLQGWQNCSCVLAWGKRLARYCQLHSQNSGVFSIHSRESCRQLAR